MKNKTYKIYDAQDRMINCASKEEVITMLKTLSNGNESQLKKIEVFDPVTGWNYADNWLRFKSQKETKRDAELV